MQEGADIFYYLLQCSLMSSKLVLDEQCRRGEIGECVSSLVNSSIQGAGFSDLCFFMQRKVTSEKRKISVVLKRSEKLTTSVLLKQSEITLVNTRIIFKFSAFRLPTHPSSVHHHNVPTKIRARPTRQEHNRALEVLRCSPASCRNSLADILQALFICQQRRVHIRLDVARRNSIYGYALGRPFVCQGFGELRNGTFGGRVGWDRESTLEGEEGAEVYDGAAAASDGRYGEGEHVRANVATEGEGSSEVYLDDL